MVVVPKTVQYMFGKIFILIRYSKRMIPISVQHFHLEGEEILGR